MDNLSSPPGDWCRSSNLELVARRDELGTSGINTFDDDFASDWLTDLCEQEKPVEFFRECLDLDGIDYLETIHCAGVVGTCAIIDGILNGPTSDMPDEAVEWIEANKKVAVKRLLPKAVAGLDAVLGENSETHDLWKENKKLYPKWKKKLQELKTRLEIARG